MPPLDILGLDWNEEREHHVERHTASWEVGELIEGGDFYAFPYPEGHPPDRWKIIGRTPSGHYVTAILEAPADRDSTR